MNLLRPFYYFFLFSINSLMWHHAGIQQIKHFCDIDYMRMTAMFIDRQHPMIITNILKIKIIVVRPIFKYLHLYFNIVLHVNWCAIYLLWLFLWGRKAASLFYFIFFLQYVSFVSVLLQRYPCFISPKILIW